jgi:ectoine hydroxylase-related dioxygenase (phytanoyl-CoA dioxygenase family)
MDFDPRVLPWIDRPDADIDSYLAKLPAPPLDYDLRETLGHWREFGYVVFEKAISGKLIDAYVSDLDQLYRDRGRFSTAVTHERRGNTGIHCLSEEDLSERHMRICDFHNASMAGKKLVLNSKVVSFLGHVFSDQVVAMQSLTFIHGSEQGLHQDFAYVVSQIPSYLAACWIALEDVHPDAGPLEFFPGSHLVKKFDFGDGMFLTGESPYREDAFARHLQDEAESRGLPRRRLFARKGDVFVWHAALVHGGSPARNPELTRKSFVAHYSSRSAYPVDRRKPSEVPREFHYNSGVLYLDPLRPSEEDAFRSAEADALRS